jgi:hypothetical protein
MGPRWEALFGMVSVVVLFVPVFVVMVGGVDRTRKLRDAARERRIAAYRQSPESQLLRLT